jgi:5-methylcytosine-specific restriction protein A
MPSYLLTWNPTKWHWSDGDFEATVAEIERFGRFAGRWSCGITKRIARGDRVFLLRQGLEPRGLIGSGWARDRPYVDEHWEDGGPFSRSALYVDVDWDWLSSAPVISREELGGPDFAGTNWNSQSSGISIEADVAHTLEREWGVRVGSRYEPPPEEVIEPEYWEGAVTSILVNVFERNAAARAKCIEHFGCKCAICAFDFEQKYGPAGMGFIHVHHIVPIAHIRKSYRIDPIRDLRPVCPNCHALIHRREPAYELDELLEMIGTTRRPAI